MGEAKLSDVQGCTIRDRATPMFDVASLDLASCHSVEFNTALNEFETKHQGLGHRFETWPPDVQRRVSGVLDEWMKRDPSRVIRLTSFCLHQGVAVLILHYQHKPIAK
jgi:hypothetical protein